MDLDTGGENSSGAFELERVNAGLDTAEVSARLFQAAYDGIIGEQPAKVLLAKSTEQTDRSDQKTDKVEPPSAVARGNQPFGDLQGQVPEAYLKYLNKYKDAGGTSKPALDVRPPADVRPVAPAPKPDQPKPDQPKPDQPKPEQNKPQPEQNVPAVPDKILPGLKPLPAPTPEVKPAPGPNPEPRPQPVQPAPRPCPKPG